MTKREFIKSLATCAGLGAITTNILKASDNDIYVGQKQGKTIKCPIYVQSHNAYEDYSNGRRVSNIEFALAMQEVNKKNYNQMKAMEARYIVWHTLQELKELNLPYDWLENNTVLNEIFSTTSYGKELNLNWGVILEHLEPNTLFIQNRQDWNFTPMKNKDNTFLDDIFIKATRRMAVFVAPPDTKVITR